MNKTKLFVISGPSGCGKTTIAQEILHRHPAFFFSVSATTRLRRASEVDGKDYFFLTREEFEEKIRQDELAEWEQIYGDYYGSLKSEIEHAFLSATSMIFDIDVKGALSIKKKYTMDSELIFIKPPSLEHLMERLKNRKTETAETFAKRMERASMEIDLAEKFDYTIINDQLEHAINAVDEIVCMYSTFRSM
jgi:guanylate kinase